MQLTTAKHRDRFLSDFAPSGIDCDGKLWKDKKKRRENIYIVFLVSFYRSPHITGKENQCPFPPDGTVVEWWGFHRPHPHAGTSKAAELPQ